MPPVDPIAAIPEPEPPPSVAEDATGSISARAPATLLVALPVLAPDALQSTLTHLAAAFPDESLLVATPDSTPDAARQPLPNLRLLPYAAEGQPARGEAPWVLTAEDYAATAALVAANPALQCILLLGETAPALGPALLRSLADCIRSPHGLRTPPGAQAIDLAVPRLQLGPGEGLVNAALLYPFTRALFAANIRFPLPANAALSPRMAQRLALAAERQLALRQPRALLWPVADAAIAGYAVRELDAPGLLPPVPHENDFNALFAAILGSLFADIDVRAGYWQRARNPIGPATLPTPSPLNADPQANAELDSKIAGAVGSEIAPMIESFRLANDNLQELWALVLPPQSRLALKRLAALPAATFDMPHSVWARIAYDFALAYHLRTLNRGHLLGAMVPLYLAWAASHLRASAAEPTLSAAHIAATAAAFEQERPYLVSRWRWPDRFNP